ncbi:MAG: hypothetical protein QOE12_1, partial [Mycobacterium sp.]|nr:hypothetical protein [Mycobacterium sp.]
VTVLADGRLSVWAHSMEMTCLVNARKGIAWLTA